MTNVNSLAMPCPWTDLYKAHERIPILIRTNSNSLTEQNTIHSENCHYPHNGSNRWVYLICDGNENINRNVNEREFQHHRESKLNNWIKYFIFRLWLSLRVQLMSKVYKIKPSTSFSSISEWEFVWFYWKNWEKHFLCNNRFLISNINDYFSLIRPVHLYEEYVSHQFNLKYK